MTRGISNPTVKWNGNAIAIASNSFDYKLGKGNKVIRAFSAGGGAVEIVTTENIESKVSMLKFSLPNNTTSINVTRQILENLDQNEFQISDPEFQATFSSMTLEEEPTIPLTEDGVIELSLKGPPATQSAIES